MHTSELNNSKCRIVVDAMGGDFAPQNIVLGAIQASIESDEFELFLVGKEDEIGKVILSNNLPFDKNNIIHADEVIGMNDSPTTSLKFKPNSSIVVGANLVKSNKADAFVSAGNTGAVMAASTLIMGRIPGVGRPTIGVAMPNINGTCYLFDIGAGKDARPQHFVEYSIMGSIYAKEIGGIINPSVGILSMGEEENKGNEVSIAAFNLLKKTKLNFIGNVEGRDILSGNVNVVICDGFVGNIILKFGEGVLNFLKFKFSEAANQSLLNKIKIALVRKTLRNILKDFDYQEYGGVPLLGVNGINIIGHGSSTPKAIKNMVLRANEMFKKKLIQKIENSLKDNQTVV